MNLNLTKSILQKALTLLCFLALPILFYLLTAFFMAAFFQILLRSLEENSEGAAILKINFSLLYSGCSALLTSIVLGVVYILSKKRTPPYAVRPKLSLLGYLYVILFGAFGAVFFNLLMELSRFPELFPTSGTIGSAARAGNPALHFFSVCLVIPIAEELVFRGFGYFGLRRLFGPVFTGILTAALFGVFHGNAPQTLYGFCMGLLLAHTAESCRNLTAPLLFHWAANLTSFALLKDPASQRLLYSIPILGLSGIGCAWLFCRIRDLSI
ncbi:MAG: CPBP family intramembrane metalloprotease [Lachnospiraceae bacterium]|nr:CPBP family intramembrane metalloprotease [Lachnospiraceae bacterium]